MYSPVRDNAELLRQAARGDQKARDLLVEQNTGLVRSVVHRFLGRGHEAEDLFQVGCIGLIKAVQRFDLSFGVRFSTYAVPMIMGEIKRYIRDDGIIKVSRSIKETISRAMAVKERMTLENGTEPTLAEIARRLDMPPEDLAAAMDAGLRPESLYALPDDGNREGRPLIERLESDTDYEAEIVDRLTLKQLLAELTPREQEILQMRYFKQKTQTQIARQMGISQVQVSRIEKKILLKMRDKLG